MRAEMNISLLEASKLNVGRVIKITGEAIVTSVTAEMVDIGDGHSLPGDKALVVMEITSLDIVKLPL